MNLQLFGYDDGFYYGQCKLIFEAETVSDNGKTVTISDGATTKSGIVANKKCEFIVPGRSLWTATLLDSTGDPEWTGKVEAGYGDCKHIMLADGYEAIMERNALSLNEIKAATNLDGYIPKAEAVKAISDSMGGIKFGVNGDGNYGYYKADDSFVPFSNVRLVKGMNGDEYTVADDVTKCLIVAEQMGNGWGGYNGLNITTNSGIKSSKLLTANGTAWVLSGDAVNVWYADTIPGGKIRVTATSGTQLESRFCVIAL